MKELGLYIHIPFCKSKCYYCDFNSYKCNDEYHDTYIQALLMELDMYDKLHDFKYKTVFIGGGTPTFINCNLIGKIMHKIKHKLTIDAEITIECNPGTVCQDDLVYYKSKGINRLSIGLQAWQNCMLKNIGRIHKVEDFINTYNMAQKAGYKNISVDLMFTLPYQTLKMWKNTLVNISKLDISHISCYGLKLEEGTEMSNMYENKSIVLPDEDLDREMYHVAVDYLKTCGFEQYEISNFSKPSYECKHNIVYWKNEEYLGVGAGSHSKLGKKRFSNYKDLNHYEVKISKGKFPIEEVNTISKEEDIWETIFLSLRLNEGLNTKEFYEKYKIRFENKYSKVLQKLISNNLIEWNGENVRLSRRGMDISNQVFIEFC